MSVFVFNLVYCFVHLKVLYLHVKAIFKTISKDLKCYSNVGLFKNITKIAL